MDEKMLNTMREECEQVFDSTILGLSNISMLRQLGEIQFQSSKRVEFGASVKVIHRSNVFLLTIFDGVYTQLFKTIEDHRDVLLNAIFPPQLGVNTSNLDVLDTLYDLAINFILQHELNHILCGHVDYHRVTMGMTSVDYSMSESLIEFDNQPDLDWLRAYYLEVEADGTAIEWMLERLHLMQLNKDLQSYLGDESLDDLADVSIMDLPKSCRDIGFRYLLMSVWLVIGLMESNRSEPLKSHNASHPLPAARLISAINLLMSYYANIGEFRTPESGEIFVTPSEDESGAMIDFFTNVVKPVIDSLMQMENLGQASALVIPYGGDDFGEDITYLIFDLYSLLKNEQTESRVISQVEKIESVRSEILKIVEQFRYMEGMKRDD